VRASGHLSVQVLRSGAREGGWLRRSMSEAVASDVSLDADRQPREVMAGMSPSSDIVLSFRQPSPSQAVCERGEIFRSADREPILEIGDTQGGIQLAQMVHRTPRFVRSAGKRMACRDDADHHQEGRQIPECLLRP
jgi:hypothetical protein